MSSPIPSLHLLGMAAALGLASCAGAKERSDAGGQLGNDQAAGDGDGKGSADDGDGTDTDKPTDCARVELMGTRVIPSVWLLVDGSGSMGTALHGGASRWSVLREALLADNSGLVPRLQASVAFGLFVYDGGLSLPGIKTELCPRVLRVEPALNNLSEISNIYPASELGASTPTHYALLALRDHVKSVGADPRGPTYVVLATDGRPNFCDFHDGVPESAATEQQAVSTVTELAEAGIKTFAISMADDDAQLAAHLDAITKAGGTGQPTFTPTTRDGLVEALNTIIGDAASCDVKLQGTIVAGSECRGEVTMNGELLECGGADGFRVKDDLQTLELRGSACDTLQRDAEAALKATFPCDEIILL